MSPLNRARVCIADCNLARETTTRSIEVLSCFQLVLTIPLHEVSVVKASLLAFYDARSPCLDASLSCNRARKSS